MYITIPSNSPNKFHNNLVNEYQVNYDVPILSNGEKYEVALSEFSYIHNLKTIESFTINIITKDNIETLSIIGGYYWNIERLVSELNSQTELVELFHLPIENKMQIKLKRTNCCRIEFKNKKVANSLGFLRKSYNLVNDSSVGYLGDYSNRTFNSSRKETVVFKVEDKDIKLTKEYYTSNDEVIEELNKQSTTLKFSKFNKNLYLMSSITYEKVKTQSTKILGFKDTSYSFPMRLTPSITGEFSVDLLAGKHYIFIYCNICQFSHLGNIKAKILRVIPIDSKNITYGELKTYRFQQEMFVPLDRQCINEIKIEVRDEFGELFPLTSGRSLVVLHFREI